MQNYPILAAKSFLVFVLILTGNLSQAQIMPVIDATNLMQTTVSASENVAQTLKQIEQYKTQLQQYQNMLQNTAAPTAYVWDQSTATINSLIGSIDTLNYYKNQAATLDQYLRKFQDLEYYHNSPCFNGSGRCTAAEKAALEKNHLLASESQKKANDALFHGLDQQQDALKADAKTLQRLQSNAQSATGQMQAIGYANQLASQQANQLLLIRGLLIAQQNTIATRQQAVVNREAAQEAAHQQLFNMGSKTNRRINKSY